MSTKLLAPFLRAPETLQPTLPTRCEALDSKPPTRTLGRPARSPRPATSALDTHGIGLRGFQGFSLLISVCSRSASPNGEKTRHPSHQTALARYPQAPAIQTQARELKHTPTVRPEFAEMSGFEYGGPVPAGADGGKFQQQATLRDTMQ